MDSGICDSFGFCLCDYEELHGHSCTLTTTLAILKGMLTYKADKLETLRKQIKIVLYLEQVDFIVKYSF